MTPAPRDTLWPLPPHTKGKHEVMRHYLAAWFPIIGSFAPRLAFIDGFAGRAREWAYLKVRLRRRSPVSLSPFAVDERIRPRERWR